jgi:hypothetical protein
MWTFLEIYISSEVNGLEKNGSVQGLDKIFENPALSASPERSRLSGGAKDLARPPRHSS